MEAESSNWIYATGSFASLALPEIPFQKADLRRTSYNSALNSPLADKGIDQPLTTTMIILSPSS